MDAPTAVHTAPTVDSSDTVESFALYIDAQAAVDYLSDKDFPVAHVNIVGRDIRIVESVSGRLTKGRAALSGAAGGAWFGLLIGVLLGLFLPGAAWITVILSAIAFSASWGLILGFVGHWATRGTRDFASTKSLEAGRYDVLVDSAHVGEATRLLAQRHGVAI